MTTAAQNHSAVANKWCVKFSESNNAKIKIFCFHHAGGAASFFGSWVKHFGEDVQLIAVQLPGRWDRINEEALNTIPEIVSACSDTLLNEVDRPFAVVGFSFGSLVAFEWIRFLRNSSKQLPIHFFPFALRAPQLAMERPFIHNLNNDEFLKTMSERYGGIPDVVLQDPEMLEIILPPLRADMRALEAYVYSEEEKLNLPITAVSGASDSIASLEKISQWKDQTSLGFNTKQFPGGHFFNSGFESQVVPFILSEIFRK